MVAVKQKRPRALAGADTAGSLRHEGSYPTRRELQALGEQFADRWIDAAIRFASALFRALTDAPILAIERVIEAAREHVAQLGPESFPTSEHLNLAALLFSFSGRRITPTVERVQQAAQLSDMQLPLGGGDQLAELRLVLRTENSAAGIGNYARELRACGRKAQQVRRLWRVLRDYLADDDIDTAPTATPIIVRRIARRRSA